MGNDRVVSHKGNSLFKLGLFVKGQHLITFSTPSINGQHVTIHHSSCGCFLYGRKDFQIMHYRVETIHY